MLFEYDYPLAQVKGSTTAMFFGYNHPPESRTGTMTPSSPQSLSRSLTDITAHTGTRTFPSEIYERVIDFCVDHDAVQYPGTSRETLCNCALTGRSWLSRAQFHLYSQVCIESDGQLRKFACTVHQNPALAQRVRLLELSGRYTLGTEGAEDFWIYYAAVHLPTLPCLENMTLRYLPSAASRSFMVFKLFRKFCSVERLWLASPRTLCSGDLGRILSSFPQLKQLTITGINHDMTHRKPLSAPIPRHLRCALISSLHLDMPSVGSSSAMSEVLKWFSEHPIINFTKLSCTLFRVGQHHNALRRLLQRCGPHLKQLNLEWPPADKALMPEYVELEALCGLEQLAISHIKVHDIDRVLSILETLNPLRRRQLTIRLTFSGDAWLLQDSDWDMLNERLLRIKGARKIILIYYASVDHTTIHRTNHADMVRNIRRNMPNLAATFRQNLTIQLHLVSLKL